MPDQWWELVDAPSYRVWFDRIVETKEVPRPEYGTEITSHRGYLVVDDMHGGLDRVPMPLGECVVFHGSTPPGESWRKVFARFAVHRPPKIGQWVPCETPDLVAADG